MKGGVGMSHHEKGGNKKMTSYIFVFQSLAGHECMNIQTINAYFSQKENVSI